MKITVTTSNLYHHLLPVFFYLYDKYWNEPFDLVGYDKPLCELPDNCTWVSLGVQGSVNDWSMDLRKYFEQQEDCFIWLMEDSFIKQPVNELLLDEACAFMMPCVGRIDLTCDLMKREHDVVGRIATAGSKSRYRLSTQPSIWNRDFLLQYLTDGLTPWQFEVQDAQDENWNVIGLTERVVYHNEGVRKNDPHKLDLNGVNDEDLRIIKNLV